MSYDLSWLWNLLGGLVDAIISWFLSLWGVTQKIVNTGQGIFTGLVAFGSALWDALIKSFNTIGSWFYNAFKWIYDGFCYIADVFGQWVSTAFGWIGSAFAWVAQQIYNFGMWIYNGLAFIWNWIVNMATGVWNAITQFFGGIASAIGLWWGSVVSGINSWFSNLVIGIRRKIVQTIIADVSIYFGWKSMERLTHASGLKEAGLSVLGLLSAPFVGYLFGNMINGIIPSPSTTPIQLIPEIAPFTYTPPTLEILTPTEKPAPYMGVAPVPPVVGAGLPYDIALRIPRAPACDYTTKTTDASLTMPSTAYDSTLESTDGSLMMPSLSLEAECLYEYYNTGDDLASTIDSTYIIAQTFTVGDADHYVTRLRLKLGKTWTGDSHPAKLRVSIRATQNGHPYGDDIVYVDVPHSQIPTFADWVSIDIPPTLLRAGTKYAIVCRGIDVDSEHYFFWRKDSTSPTYLLGNEEVSTDGGETWTSVDHDQMFEVYGY
jgi:hypothetical protein